MDIMVKAMKRYYPNKPKKSEIKSYIDFLKSLNDKIDKKAGENNVENKSDNKEYK